MKVNGINAQKYSFNGIKKVESENFFQDYSYWLKKSDPNYSDAKYDAFVQVIKNLTYPKVDNNRKNNLRLYKEDYSYAGEYSKNRPRLAANTGHVVSPYANYRFLNPELNITSDIYTCELTTIDNLQREMIRDYARFCKDCLRPKKKTKHK